MQQLSVLVCILSVVCTCLSQTTDTGSVDAERKLIQEMNQRFDEFQKTTKETIHMLSRQLMLQQQHVEERIRSDGNSGVKQTRVSGSGTRPYFANTFTGIGVASGHDHANYDRTVGLGEFIAVLNGVEFRTRHNDYKIRMPSTNTKTWNQLEDIPFPPVPQSVLQKNTVQEQIVEMREYFRAFHDQNTHIRDWLPYFKPVMCYLEGGWTTNTKTLEEPFHSDRHLIEASSWLDLQEKIRYTAYSGSKNNNENLSYLPTTIVNVTEDGFPVFAQWNYRLACHPIKTYLDLRYIRLVDDLAVRMSNRQNLTAYANSRVARFAVTPDPGHYIKSTCHAEYEYKEKSCIYDKIDEIMSEIPGKDNYPGHLTGTNFGLSKYKADMQNTSLLNTARYHRMYKVKPFGDYSQAIREDGFSDRNLWIAETSNPRIASMGATDCHHDNNKEVCTRYEGRYTFAIPMEIVWLTPLSTWNPYNVTIYDVKDKAKVTAGRRTGEFTPEKAFTGVAVDNYYLTPTEFFSGREVNRNIADTARKSVGVLDQHGQVQKLSASGIRFLLPAIDDIGTIRTRYPIMPVHQEGSAIWKNLQALQDITMDMNQHANMFYERPDIHTESANTTTSTHYVTTDSHLTPPAIHHHDVFIREEDMKLLRDNATLKIFTMEVMGHKHELEVHQDPIIPNALFVNTCDGYRRCFDRHGIRIYHFK